MTQQKIRVQQPQQRVPIQRNTSVWEWNERAGQILNKDLYYFAWSLV